MILKKNMIHVIDNVETVSHYGETKEKSYPPYAAALGVEVRAEEVAAHPPAGQLGCCSCTPRGNPLPLSLMLAAVTAIVC
jgi:hypothetical protein